MAGPGTESPSGRASCSTPRRLWWRLRRGCCVGGQRIPLGGLRILPGHTGRSAHSAGVCRRLGVWGCTAVGP